MDKKERKKERKKDACSLSIGIRMKEKRGKERKL